MKHYVQHISGQGEKWEVSQEYKERWDCPVPTGYAGVTLVTMLPKSEYVLCDPPERWVDVTKDIEVVDCPEHSELMHDGVVVNVKSGKYRLRKVQQFHEYYKDSTWAFIVEKREV